MFTGHFDPTTSLMFKPFTTNCVNCPKMRFKLLGPGRRREEQWVMISELGESSMVVRITLGASDPEIAFQLKSYVQEHIVDYLNQFKKGSLIGAVADQKPP